MEILWELGRLDATKSELQNFCRMASGMKNHASSVKGIGNTPDIRTGTVMENRLFFDRFASVAFGTALSLRDAGSLNAVIDAVSSCEGGRQLQSLLAAYRVGALCKSEDVRHLRDSARLSQALLTSWQNANGREDARGKILFGEVLNLGIKAAWDSQDYGSLMALSRILERQSDRTASGMLPPVGMRVLCRMLEGGRNGVREWLDRMYPRRLTSSIGSASLLHASMAWKTGLEGDVAASRRSLSRAGVFSYLSSLPSLQTGVDNSLSLSFLDGPILRVDDLEIGVRWSLLESTAHIAGVDDVDVAKVAVFSGRTIPRKRRALFDSLFEVTERKRVRALLEVIGPDEAIERQCVSRYLGTRLPRIPLNGRTACDIHDIKDSELQRVADICYALRSSSVLASQPELAAAVAEAVRLSSELTESEAVSAEAYCVAAIVSFYAQDASAARKWVRRAIETDEEWAFPLEILGWIDWSLGQLPSAVGAFRACVKKTPSNSGWLLPLAAIVSMQIGNSRSVEKAEEYCNTAVAADARNPLALIVRSTVRTARGRYRLAVADALDAILASGDSVTCLNDAAWLLATSPDEEARNGKMSLRLARKACARTNWVHPPLLDTLAAACAECGRFEQAVVRQEKALELLPPSSELQEEMEARLQLYRDKKPYRMERSAAPEQKSQK
jgi:tetratricopeptide (TPR) repeat protein